MRKFILYLIITIVIIAAILISMGNYFYDIALNRNTKKDFVVGNPEIEKLGLKGNLYNNIQSDIEVKEEDYLAEDIIEQKTDKSNLSIKSYDNLNLSAVCYKQKISSDKWVIAVHGYGGRGLQMVSPALSFFNKGYNALIPDCRGHGNSGGNYIGMGWHDRLDIISWVDEIIRKYPNAKIVLYGVSMGGSAVIMATGESLPENVKCVIEDCGFTSAYAQFAYQVNRLFSIPYFPIVSSTSFICGIRAKYTLKDASALKQVNKSKTPTLFIHGSEDDYVPTRMVYELYNSAPCEKDLLIIKGAGHGNSYSHSPNIYWGKVFDFLYKYVKA